MNELLCLLNLAQLKAKDRQRIRELLLEVRDWQPFFERIQTNAVFVLTYSRLKTFEIDLIGTIGFSTFKKELSLLARQVELFEVRARKRCEWVGHFLDRMSSAGIQVIVLKGGLLGYTLYEFPIYKKMNDIDILVRFEQAEQASKILKELGFTCVGNLFGQEEISASTHHAPPYVSSDLSCVVGLHWNIHSKYTPWKADLQGIWDRKHPVKIAGTSVFRMSWEDHLLHLCVHLPFYKIGLRELADVYNTVLFCNPTIDWSAFKKRVEEWGAEDPAFRVLSLANSLMPLGLSGGAGEFKTGLLEEWKRKTSYFCVKDTLERATSKDLLLQSRSTAISRVEKAFSIFRVSENYLERLKAWAAMWKWTFFPREEDVKKLTRCNQPKNSWQYFKARLDAPFLILGALSRDYGKGMILLITIVNILTVIRETLFFRFLRQRPEILSGSTRELLEALE